MNIAHVLVVDDDNAVCRIVHRMLSHENYEVRAASSVADALKVIEQESFDVYLLDYKLPDGSGLDVAARIREKWGSVPIVLISGYDPAIVALRAQQLGITEFLQKPFSREIVCEVVKKVLDSSSSSTSGESDPEAKKPLLMNFIPRLDGSNVPWKD
jgi:two-component system, NtrC family, response regulator HydG